MFITKQSTASKTTKTIKCAVNPIFAIHSKILVTTYSASASLNSLIYNFDLGARSFVTPCLYMHMVTSLDTLCDTPKLSPLFAFKLIAKNDKKKSNNVGDLPKLMIFNGVRIFNSRIKGKKGEV
jgi:hypothetical protein